MAGKRSDLADSATRFRTLEDRTVHGLPAGRDAAGAVQQQQRRPVQGGDAEGRAVGVVPPGAMASGEFQIPESGGRPRSLVICIAFY
ncbi:hypothetical protein [Xylella fastidiosa]|uniref:hypothetical protein n=1 Tax=Xylella fastidiosa TaxID=2371 RepID=UPI000AB819AA|nr:hypothetical protein [Xylella fastidiosa]TNW26457.1 hypothetical protein EIP74_09250 [Xylella fastidiosa subsp. pauca]